jgi:TolB protein
MMDLSPSPTSQPTLSPTVSTGPATPSASSLEGEELLAWSVAATGEVYVLNSNHILHQLSPDTLVSTARSTPLIAAKPGSTYLLAGDQYLFVGSSTISQTLVLDRIDFEVVERLESFGPLALDPGHRLFVIPQGLEDAWPFGNFEIWAYDLSDLAKPPEKVRQAGASMDDLAIDPASGRLYVLTSNVAASPPHQGQTYVAYSLESLEPITEAEWERGSLTRPVINARTGEIASSRIGLNWTRRVLVLDQNLQEVRSRPSLDGQPAIDAAGQWLYLLRERGLWVLREKDLALQTVLPFAKEPPLDLALSPDGEILYLFGSDWLTALAAAELRELGVVPVGPLPMSWFSQDRSVHYLVPRVYPSPQMEKDGVAFVQLVSGAENVLETYVSADRGQSWSLVPSLIEPDLAGAAFLSLSPDFAQDQTLTALVGSTMVRSTDGGLTWQSWQSRIAFTSDRDGNREIYSADREGQDVRRLTDSPAAEENPAWSPAWTRIAFQSNRNGNWDIFTMRADCSPAHPEAENPCDLRQLTDDPGDDLLPAWSPDGRAIAFVSTQDGNPEIYVMSSSGEHQRRLTFHSSGDWRPAWLPDSKHLLFVSDRSGNNDIYQLSIPPFDLEPPTVEPEIVPVIVSPADDRDPTVVAGLAERLLFLSDRDGIMRTYVADGDSAPRPFAETEQPEAHPAALPGEFGTILISSEGKGSPDLYRADFSGYTALAPSNSFDGHPAGGAAGWEPDVVTSLDWLQEQE